MARLREHVIRAGLETLYFSGAHRLIGHFLHGVGVILTLHHVRPPRHGAFHPNRILEITPQFLDDVIAVLRAADIDLVSLDEAARRLEAQEFGRRFACLTFDDGYRDNRTYAYPILKRNGVPFAIYIPTSFMDREGYLWWLALEDVIAARDEVLLIMDGVERRFACATVEEKNDAFAAIYWWLRSLPSDAAIRCAVRALAARYGIDGRAYCNDLCLDWDELVALAADPLVTVGAHTVNHPILAKIPADALAVEIESGCERIARRLGARPRHFSFPFGDRSAAGPREFAAARAHGFRTAVTTRPGVLFPEHREHLMALPRISINGDYQRRRYFNVLLSGAATAMWNGLRRVDAA